VRILTTTFLLFLCLSTACLSAAPLTWKDFESEEEALLEGCDTFLLAMADHSELLRVLLTVNAQAVEDFWASEPVRDFIDTHYPALLDADPWAHPAPMVDYLDGIFKTFTPKAIATWRKASLQRAAAVRGLKLPKQNVRKAFEDSRVD
jgi:hypothetical protein